MNKKKHIRNMEASIRSVKRRMKDIKNYPFFTISKARRSLYYFEKQIEITKRKLK